MLSTWTVSKWQTAPLIKLFPMSVTVSQIDGSVDAQTGSSTCVNIGAADRSMAQSEDVNPGLQTQVPVNRNGFQQIYDNHFLFYIQ